MTLKHACNSLLGLVLVLLAVPAASALELLVPAYFYPSPRDTLWQTMTDSVASVSITAILNPDDGPGEARDENYVDVVQAHQAAGGRVVGYVETRFGRRDVDDLREDIDRHFELYGVDGIFIDEMPDHEDGLAYYRALYDYVKAISGDAVVIGNSGTNTQEGYLDVADILVTFEGTLASYRDYTPDAWTAHHDAGRFGHLVYGVPGSDDMRAVADWAVSRNVGHLYVTSDSGRNPWDSLPAYWAEEAAYVASVPEPGVWASLLAGLGLVGLAARRRAMRQGDARH